MVIKEVSPIDRLASRNKTLTIFGACRPLVANRLAAIPAKLAGLSWNRFQKIAAKSLYAELYTIDTQTALCRGSFANYDNFLQPVTEIQRYWVLLCEIPNN